MALKSISRVPSLAERLTQARVVRFNRDSPALQNCIISGLIPVSNKNRDWAYNKITAGKAIVGGVLFETAEMDLTLTKNITNCVWIDDEGVVQVGETFPASGNFARIAGVKCTAIIQAVYLDSDYRDWKLGYDPVLEAFVAPAPAEPGTRRDIYSLSTNYTYESGLKFCMHGTFGQAVLIDEIQVRMKYCSVSGSDKVVTARAGFMEPDEQTWIEDAYKDIAPANGEGYKVFTFDEPWLPTLQKEYVLCLECTEYGESIEYGDFALYGSPAYANQEYQDKWVFDVSLGILHRQSTTKNWEWKAHNPSWSIRGYPAQGAHMELAAEALAEAPATFQALLNKRACHLGACGPIDPATQFVKAEASLDGGAHWATFAEGEDIGTPHTGTDLIFRVTAGNNNAADIQIPSVGFAYEI